MRAAVLHHTVFAINFTDTFTCNHMSVTMLEEDASGVQSTFLRFNEHFCHMSGRQNLALPWHTRSHTKETNRANTRRKNREVSAAQGSIVAQKGRGCVVSFSIANGGL